ncbi:macrophage mannose receptor 1-like [Paramacrobiotus metropolitanus]|uniref:macrophage mannose receptor 1-like n=1 Tax=Paramacrobiotus metropolitanus TaxID=2943436 RepID=UPI0024463540|nr:macrophage mannose receptor 1-like [Paramacrobiotus metropolitanus]
MMRLWLFCLFVAGISAYRCPGPDWHARENTDDCYYVDRPDFDSTGKSWEEASQECQIRGGNLADSYSQADLDYLKTRLHNAPGIGLLDYAYNYYWIDLSYASGEWKWQTSGRVFTEGDLGSYNPNRDSYFTSSTASERAKMRVTIRHREDGYVDVAIPQPGGLFGTTPRKGNFICKAAHSSRPLCKTEQGWSYINGRCWMFHRQMATWDAAQKICFAEGGYIGVPNSDEENTRITVWERSISVSDAWLGLKVTKDVNTFPSNVIWLDGTSMLAHAYNQWPTTDISGYLNQLSDGTRYCGVHKRSLTSSQQSKWELSASCDTTRAYACETDTEKCPYGWEHYSGQCYSIEGGDDNLANWGEASLRCIGMGGHLAIITDSNVQSFLVQHIRRMGWSASSIQYFYLGLSANPNAGFTWVNNNDALSSSYLNWATGQPPVTNTRRCAYMQMTETNGQWAATTNCLDPLGYVCQARVGNANITEYVKPEAKCDPPFEKYHGTCFYYSGKPDNPIKKNWQDAVMHCRSLNSTLAEITSAGENNFIREYLSARAWIGYKRQPSESGSDIIRYSDDRIVPGTAFTNYRSTFVFENKYCYAMLPPDGPLALIPAWGKWDIESCDDENFFVCTHRGPMTFLPTRPATDLYTPECGADWAYVGGHCYKINLERAPYDYASQMCRGLDPTSNLVYIRDDNENNVLKDLINEKFNNISIPGLSNAETFWTGLRITNKNQWHWAYRNEHMWSKPMAFTNWAPNQPNPSLSYSTVTPKCGFLRRDASAEWEASECDLYRPFICKKHAVRPQNATEQTGTTTASPPLGMNFTMGCKPGWQRSGDHCYHHYRNQTDWFTAFQHCRTFGNKFRLAELHNQANFDEVGAFLNGGWIGMDSVEKPQSPRQFIYLHNRQVPNYTPWESQLSRPAYGENCVAMSGKGLVAYNCGEIKSYTCMTEVTPVELDPNECLKPVQDHGCRRWGYGRGHKCYYMGNDASHFGTRELVNFQQARAFCQQNFGGDLAVVNSDEVQQFMTFLIGSWGSDYWIGLREDANPWNSFKKWINGEDVAYTNWAHNEPHFHQQTTGCVAMHSQRTDTAETGDWYVGQCDVAKFALCEAPRNGWSPPTPRPTAHFVGGCPRGWKAPSDPSALHCYYAFAPPDQLPNQPVDPTKLTWQEAETSCNAFGGHLASIATEFEYRHILDNVLPNRNSSYSYWIGLQENIYGDFEWSDGTPYGTFAFWHPNYNQNNEIISADCVAMDGNEGKWFVQSCNLAWGWVCEIPRGWYNETDDIMQVTVPAPTITNARCPSGSTDDGDWFYHAQSDKCFFVSRVKDSWENAHMACNLKGTNLASVSSTQQPFLMTILTRYAAHDNLFWLGLRLTHPTKRQYSWVDNNQDVYRNWGKDEPHLEGIEGCGAISNVNGKWRDANCQRQLHYICMQGFSVVNPPTLPPVQEEWGCPNCPDCIIFRDHCYFISPTAERKSWKAAEQACHDKYFADERGYRLTSVHNQFEQDFLSTYLMKDEIDRWGGLYQDPSRAFQFYWSDQTPIDYTNWVPGEPNYHPEGAVCGEIKGPKAQAGKWNDDLCTVEKGYICKGRRESGAWKPSPASLQGSCPIGYVQVGDACFVVREVNGDRDRAQSVCTQSDPSSRIASVLDAMESMQAHLLLGEKENYPSATGPAKAWLGLTYENGKLQYRESSCYTSFNNIQDFYSYSGRDKKCVYMEWNGKWKLEDCTGVNATLKYTICERRLTPCQTVPPQFTGHCPTGFPNECNDYCLALQYNTVQAPNSIAKKSFQEARVDCQSRGGSLVSIRSQQDQECLMRYMKDAFESLWIGLYEQYDVATNSYTWKWIDDTVALGNFANWNTGEPTYFNPREDCVEILPNGLWNNVPCNDWYNTRRGYVCEARKIGDGVSTQPPQTTRTQPTVPTAPSVQTIPTPTTRQTPPPQPGSSTSAPTGPTHQTPAGGSSTGSTRREEGTPPPTILPETYTGGIGAGGLAGIGVTIAILVPALTVAGYIFWKRRNVGHVDKSQSSFKRGMAVDEEPVIDPEQAYDSYT